MKAKSVGEERWHIPPEMLERFIEGTAARSENRQIVAHLLRGCDACAARSVAIYRPAVTEETYDAVLDRVIRRFVPKGGVEPPKRGKVLAFSR
jgi:hypothetical protein